MSLTIAKLAAERRTVTWRHLDEEVRVVYKPGALTLNWVAQVPAEALVSALISLDILDDKGEPIALDAKILGALPDHVLRSISSLIFEDASLDPTTAETSGAS